MLLEWFVDDVFLLGDSLIPRYNILPASGRDFEKLTANCGEEKLFAMFPMARLLKIKGETCPKTSSVGVIEVI